MSKVSRAGHGGGGYRNGGQNKFDWKCNTCGKIFSFRWGAEKCSNSHGVK